ncbi:hypothetical protein PIB30_032434 [Stylosanthes scabra]|uniref:RNase H type-1 domain-containing protein n=1 Tax=Stylosanthes scabra TaxID=79078 RepID=A0ABU6Z9X9_9FABA|nr:hypothetical protein [Stylosanthes scabra]
MEKLDPQNQGFLCTCLLALWTSHNELLFEENIRTPMEIVEVANQRHDEFIAAQTATTDAMASHPPGARSVEKWETPPTNEIKINVDAACIDEEMVGIGVVAKDSFGSLLMASMWKASLSVSSKEAEALACMMGLEKAQECFFLASRFRSVEFYHVKRSGNMVAHEVTQMAFTNADTMWLEEAPANICNLALLDIPTPIHE